MRNNNKAPLLWQVHPVVFLCLHFLYRVYQDWLWVHSTLHHQNQSNQERKKKLANNCWSNGIEDPTRILCSKPWEHSNWSKICSRRRSTRVRAQVKPHQFGTSYTIQWKCTWRCYCTLAEFLRDWKHNPHQWSQQRCHTASPFSILTGRESEEVVLHSSR